MTDAVDPDETAGRRLYRTRADTLARAQGNYRRRKVTMTDSSKPSAEFDQWFDALPEDDEAPYILAWQAYLRGRQEAAAEIDRLRAALREIEDSSNDPRAVREARAVLGGKP